VIGDLMQLNAIMREDLFLQVEQDRLAAQLPRRRSVVRHTLALACRRAAKWLDHSANRYVQPSQSGPVDWATRPTSAYICRADSVTPPAARDYATRPTDQLILR